MADSIDTQAAALIESAGDLTSADIFGLLAGDGPGETTAAAAETGKPDAGAEAQPEAKPAAAAAPAVASVVEEDPANSVILAKDGKHTIGYEKLVEAREAAKAAADRAAALQADNDALKAQLQARPAAGTPAPAPAPSGEAAAGEEGEAIFGDYTEEQMAKGVQKLIDKAVEAALAKVRTEVDGKLAPVQEKAVKDANTAHYEAIFTPHPDAADIVESNEFAAWKATQPRLVQQAYTTAIKAGSAADIVDVLDAYRVAHPKADPAAAPAAAVPAGKAAKDAAAAIVAKAKTKTPTSLTDIPAGAAAAVDEAGALEELNPQDLMTKFGTMNRADIEKTLAKFL